MADNVAPEIRSRIMSSVKQKNTRPELVVRSLLHRLKYRFRLHRADLPGKPDIILPKYRTVVFVHGCFWHQHESCRRAARPTSKVDYWNAKLDGNVERDKKNVQSLNDLGWKTVIVWECELKDLAKLSEKFQKTFR